MNSGWQLCITCRTSAHVRSLFSANQRPSVVHILPKDIAVRPKTSIDPWPLDSVQPNSIWTVCYLSFPDKDCDVRLNKSQKLDLNVVCRVPRHKSVSQLNGNSMNSVDSRNLINHWSINWNQFKDPACYMCLVGLLHKRPFGLSHRRHKIRRMYFSQKHCQWIQRNDLGKTR